jgi:oligopeptide transport system permease protein
MIQILMRKGLFALLSLFMVATLTFCLMKAIPGDPFQQEQALPTAIHESLRNHYGLNDPLIAQYARYLKQLVVFDFGNSLIYKERSVSQMIREGFPTSALLGLEALAIAIPSGLIIGILAAFHHQRWQESVIVIATIIGISIPSFILANILQYTFAIKLHWFPIARWGSLIHSILPAFSLAALPAAFIARMTRTKLLEELRQGYIATARSKGLPESAVLLRHALRNVLTPILSYLGPLSANILTGSFIIEKIYSIPGLGYWFVSSVLNRDYPTIMGITIFYCTLLLIAAFLVDALCLLLDPRLVDASKTGRTIR